MDRILRNPWIPHRPTSKQMRFLISDDLELFYGGAAAGGKSEALLMGALMYAETPGYAAIIFRKKLTDLQLPKGLIPRAHEWLQGRAKWNGSTHTFTFPSGSTLTFGYMDGSEDHFRYQSSEYQYAGFDELPEFDEFQYRFIFSRLRRGAGVEVPIRMRATGNPMGPGVPWVKRRFIDKQTATVPFIPANLDDNPHIDKTEYIRSLSMLDPVTRSRLLEGNWEIPTGGMFKRSWFQLVREVPAGCKAVRYWDLAATAESTGVEAAYTAGALIAAKDGVFYLVDLIRTRSSPLDVERLIRQTCELDHERGFAVVETWMEQEPGSSGVNTIDHYARDILRGYTFRGDKVTGSKEDRARPWSSAAEAGNMKLLAGPWINAFLDEAEAFPESKFKDQVDAVSGAFDKFRKGRPSGVIDFERVVR